MRQIHTQMRPCFGKSIEPTPQKLKQQMSWILAPHPVAMSDLTIEAKVNTEEVAHKKALKLAEEVADEQLEFEHASNKQVIETDEEPDHYKEMIETHFTLYDSNICPCLSMQPVFSEDLDHYFTCDSCNALRERLNSPEFKQLFPNNTTKDTE